MEQFDGGHLRWLKGINDVEMTPLFMRRFNFWAMVVFTIMIVPSVLWWKDSVPFLVFISVWANLAGHLSAWQASRVEERQEKEADDEET